MNINLRAFEQSDIPFMKEMLYEAVFWRTAKDKRPTLETALTWPGVNNSIENFGNQDGDVAVIATTDSKPVACAWFRYYTEKRNIRGYISDDIPAIAIAVHEDYRHRGIGGLLMKWLIDYAANHSIAKLSLCVSKDNYAINLYKQQGFVEHTDIGDSFNMIRHIDLVKAEQKG